MFTHIVSTQLFPMWVQLWSGRWKCGLPGPCFTFLMLRTIYRIAVEGNLFLTNIKNSKKKNFLERYTFRSTKTCFMSIATLLNFQQKCKIFFCNFSLIPGTLFFKSLYVVIFLLGPHLQHMEIPGLGVELEQYLLAYTTATAIPDLSRICDLYCSFWQHRSVTHWGQDQTCILTETMLGP